MLIGRNTDQENIDQEITDQENADQENADQEKYWSAKLSLCASVAVLASPSPDVANLFSQKVNQSIKNGRCVPLWRFWPVRLTM